MSPERRERFGACNLLFLAIATALLLPLSALGQVPTGETTSFFRWGTGNRAAQGLWVMTLEPAAMNFNGRRVTERNPGGGGPDTCWFPGSAIAPFVAISGGTWTVAQIPFNNNVYGYDFVGWNVTSVNYYRNLGRANPRCGTTPGWTFNAGPEGTLFTITDVAVAGDQFLVLDNGSPILLTNPVSANYYVCENGGPAYLDPQICLYDPNLSHGEVLLPEGSHDITILAANSPYLGGVADFRWARLPEPGSLLLFGSGLVAVMRRITGRH